MTVQHTSSQDPEVDNRFHSEHVTRDTRLKTAKWTNIFLKALFAINYKKKSPDPGYY